MGNNIGTQIGPLDYFLHDLDIPNVVYESGLGKGRFLKTLKCVSDEGPVIVKVYSKRDINQSLKEQESKLEEIKNFFALITDANVCCFHKWFDSDRAAYIVRQYFANNLYDRISTRPFLATIEKKWIVYQILQGLIQANFYGICHGDVKCENVVVTSWNWVYVTDFASYKPVTIPQDNPADFSFFFDSMGRRTGYIAPERFTQGTDGTQTHLTHEMDIFSVGCVIAELFLDGNPIFSFSQLLSYIKGEYNPESLINRINDPSVQELVKHMIQKDPSKRFSAQKYLSMWTGTIFPPYFEQLHTYIANIMKMDPDEKILTIRKEFYKLVHMFTGVVVKDKEPSTVVAPEAAQGEVPNETPSSSPRPSSSPLDYTKPPADPSLLEQLPADSNANTEPDEFKVNVNTQDKTFGLLAETERFIHELKSDLEGAARSPRNVDPSPARPAVFTIKSGSGGSPIINTERYSSVPAVGSKTATWNMQASAQLPAQREPFKPLPGSEGLVLILNIICAFSHSVKYPSTKIQVLQLFSMLSRYLDSEIKLQRIVPYIVSMLNDDNALVCATAIRVLTSVLDLVDTFPPSDSRIFPAYILPAMAKFTSPECDELIREAYAENLAQLAEISRRFLETSQFFKQNADANSEDSSMMSYQESYDAELTEIQDAFYDVVVEMLTKEPSTAVRRTLLSDITRLCIFFGRQKTNDFILPLIISFLNARHDWELRCAFFNNIVGVSAFVGVDSLEHYILPCILQALTDEEEFVIDKAVNSLASLCELGLFRKHKLLDIAEKTAPMLFLPSTWIRYGVIAIMSAIAKQLKLADIHCFLIPILKPFLVTELTQITEQNLLQALKPPVNKSSFDQAMLAAFESLANLESSSGSSPGPMLSPTPSQSNLVGSNMNLSTLSSGSQPQPIPSTAAPSASAPSSSSADPKVTTSTVRDSIQLHRSESNLSTLSVGSPLSSSVSSNLATSPLGSQLGLTQSQVSVIEEVIDPFDVALSQRLSGLGIAREEEEKLFCMKSFLKTASRASFTKGKQGGNVNEQPSFSNLSSMIPVHSISVPNQNDKRTMIMRMPIKNITQSNLNLMRTASSSSSVRDLKKAMTDPIRSKPSMDSPMMGAKLSRMPANLGTNLAISTSNFFTQLFPPSAPDMGALDQTSKLTGETLKDWAPKGILVAHLHEHKASVNQVVVSQDNMFFVSASDDGAIKVWDCQRLEKNVTNRSRLTYSSQGGKIKAIAICENSHSVATGSDKGTIHICRIDYNSNISSNNNNMPTSPSIKREQHKYTAVAVIKSFDSSSEGAIVGIEHYTTSNASVIVYGTTMGKIHAYDLRMKKEAWCLTNDIRCGLLTTFMVEPGRKWLVSGTASGYFTCWDLRFQIPVKTWGYPHKTRIHKLAHCPRMPNQNDGRDQPLIFATTGTSSDVTAWNVETGACAQLYRISNTTEMLPLPNLESLPPPKATDYGIDELQNSSLTTQGDNGIKAIYNPPDSPYLFTAGDDRKIRLWNLGKPVDSYTVTGSYDPVTYNSHTMNGVQVFQEVPDPNNSISTNSNMYKIRGSASPAVYHKESILDIKAIEMPHRMLISAGRDSIIKVWK